MPSRSESKNIEMIEMTKNQMSGFKKMINDYKRDLKR
jgi:hypothetical protein